MSKENKNGPKTHSASSNGRHNGNGATLTQCSRLIRGDARNIEGVEDESVDVILTSPPYWRGRDYGHRNQIGHENTPDRYVEVLTDALDSWRPFLRPHGSVFINIADTFHRGFLAGIPARFEIEVRSRGWHLANHAIWAKDYGMPEARPYRLARRHESIFHLVLGAGYYFDMFALQEHLGLRSNPGNLWRFHHDRSKSEHLAPFPTDLARYALLLCCPKHVCPDCLSPFKRVLGHTMDLDPERPQARRALELYRASNLTKEHIAAVRAVGISDAGKGSRLQSGAGQNNERVQRLAREAKKVLKGYFREFTFAKKKHKTWRRCRCGVDAETGTVLDPFVGSGTTLRVAKELGFNSIGVDLRLPKKSRN
jgi:DNA modification methylase